MNLTKIAKEINYDIEIGIYADFKKLGKRLETVAHKLVKASYIENYDISLDVVKVLFENNYIERFEYEDFLCKKT